MRGRCLAAGALLALLLLPLPSLAATFIEVTETDLVAGSEAIVEGRVFAQTALQREDGVIVTDSVIEVRDALVGEVEKYVTVRTIGGELGEMVVEVPGFPRFQADERLVLFLERHPLDGTFRVRGYQRGHYRVLMRSGRAMAVPALDGGAHVLRPDGTPAPAPAEEALSLLKQRIVETARSLGRDDVRADHKDGVR